MNKGKRVIEKILLLLMAVMGTVILFFNLAYCKQGVDAGVVEIDLSLRMNGLFFITAIGSGAEAWAQITGVICYMILLMSITAFVFAIASFFVEGDWIENIVGISVVVMATVYLILGFIVASKWDGFTTAAFWPLAVIMVLGITFAIVHTKMRDDN